MNQIYSIDDLHKIKGDREIDIKKVVLKILPKHEEGLITYFNAALREATIKGYSEFKINSGAANIVSLDDDDILTLYHFIRDVKSSLSPDIRYEVILDVIYEALVTRFFEPLGYECIRCENDVRENTVCLCFIIKWNLN